MENSKKKVVTKVILKNILAWVCTLCMVLCLIPSNAKANGDGEALDGVTTETGTVSVTLKLDDASWAEQNVVLVKDDGSSEACTYADGVYSAEIPLDVAVRVQVNNMNTGISFNLMTEQATGASEIRFYSVSFKNSDGTDSDIASQKVLVGNTAVQPAAPEKAGFVFDKWLTEQGGDTAFEFSTAITKATVLYASWKPEEIPGHTHEWSEEWSHNEEAHWHECTAEDCPVEWDADHIEAADGYGAHEFEIVDAPETKAPTCTEQGWEVVKCSGCGYRYGRSVAATGHDIDTDVWETDGTHHWHACKTEGCDERVAEAEHRENRGIITTRPTTAADGERTYTCEICGNARTVAIPKLAADHENNHVYSEYLIYDNDNHWYECDCGEKKDEKAHDFSEDWTYDNGSHWHECVCGLRQEEAEHTWDEGKVTTEPTVTTDGEKTYSCTQEGCEAEKTEVIPKTEPSGEAGEVVLEQTVQGSNTPAVTLTTEINELAEAILTQDEKARYMNGENLTIELTVDNITRTIEEPTKDLINRFIGNYHYQVGQYLDIKMYKTISTTGIVGTERLRVSETNDVIRICIAVPDSLKDKDGSKGRTYAVVRLHNNIPMILQDMDDDANTITLETDRFSTYAIIYRDTAGTNDGNGNNGNDDNNNNNNNNNNNGNTNNNNNGNNGNNSNNNGGNTGTNGGNGNDSGASTIINNVTITNSSNNGTTNRGNVPKTGDTSPIGMYMTIAILSGFAYLLLLFTDKQRRMTEEEKNDLISTLSYWARKRGITAKCFAGFSIACILFYYHTVGKRLKSAVRAHR